MSDAEASTESASLSKRDDEVPHRSIFDVLLLIFAMGFALLALALGLLVVVGGSQLASIAAREVRTESGLQSLREDVTAIERAVDERTRERRWQALYLETQTYTFLRLPFDDYRRTRWWRLWQYASWGRVFASTVLLFGAVVVLVFGGRTRHLVQGAALILTMTAAAESWSLVADLARTCEDVRHDYLNELRGVFDRLDLDTTSDDVGRGPAFAGLAKWRRWIAGIWFGLNVFVPGLLLLRSVAMGRTR